MADRGIPEGNPIIVEKERKRLRQVHLQRLRDTKPSIDTSLPKGFSRKKGGGLKRKKNLNIVRKLADSLGGQFEEAESDGDEDAQGAKAPAKRSKGIEGA